MPKKPIVNGFMLYVGRRKRECERDGEKFNNINDAIQKFSPEWESMSKEEKEPYNDEAKAKKEAIRKAEADKPIQAQNVNLPNSYVSNNGNSSNNIGYPG